MTMEFSAVVIYISIYRILMTLKLTQNEYIIPADRATLKMISKGD